MAKTHQDRLNATSDVRDLSASPLLDELNGSELVVYIRLIGQRARTARRRMVVRNRDLHRDASTASRALAALEAHGLVRVHGDGAARTVEVL